MSQIAFPIETDFIIQKDDPVRLLAKVTEVLNYTNLHKKYFTLGRNPVMGPAILFRILIYDYMKIYL